MTSSTHRRSQGPRLASAVAASVSAGIVLAVVGASGFVLPLPAAQAAVSSAVTVTAADQDPDVANAPLPNLEVTVSQTADLLNQGVLVSWTGGERSTPPSGQVGGTNFLQIMQCWGDDPANPGQPDRTTCQYGGLATPSATRDGSRSSIDSVAAEDLQYTVRGTGSFSPSYTSIPFRARNGVVVSGITTTNGVNSASGVDVNNNQFFTRLTTNEVPWAGSGEDGSGSAKVELQTAAQSPGLGCGNPVTNSQGAVSGESCWLVIIPRGTADAGENTVRTSGLFYDTWKHRIAIKLDFRALGTRCNVGAAERQLSGSELIAAAVASWQPVLCSATGGSVYSLITGAEADAAAAANSKIPAPLALTSRALTDVKDSLQYAPVALTGVTVGFAVDRFPKAFGGVPDDVLARSALPFESMNLTPRLVAKLLTNSYIGSLPSAADRSHVGYVSQSKPGKNALNLTSDPDFLAVNDVEWSYQSLSAASLADLLVPQGRSDAAWAVWAYVMADKDAVAFLKGEPDPWGMIVNPWSSTVAEVNRSGTALALPRDNFPKADPIEAAGSELAGPVNLVTWRPYTNDLDTSAYLTLRGDGQILGAWDSFSIPPKYGKAARSLPGSQKVLGLTDAASAARYVVVSAALLNPAGKFVAPTAASFTAAAAAMTPSPSQPQVLGFDPESAAAKTAVDAYPLTLPVYAAVNPLMSDAALRESYAKFIYYASSPGQQPGTSLGDLPAGYAPLPAAWRDRARAAADSIFLGTLPTSALTPATTTTTQSTSSSSSSSATAPLPESTPSPTGAAAGPLAGGTTPDDPNMVAVSATVPLVVIVAVVAALLVPLIPRFRKPL